MPTKVQRLRLRLFVEGVELPIISCQVQVQPNSPIMASIQIPPLAEATRFLPRSLVHVFFLDFNDEDNPNIRKTGASVTKNPSPSVYEREKQREDFGDTISEENFQTDVSSNKYKLLFVGEVMGFQWTKNATQRSVVLQCSDLSNYWDYAFQFNNNDLFGPGLKAMFSGGSTNLFTDFLSSPGGAVVGIILTPSVRYPGLQGLMGGIVHLLEAMGGSYYYDKVFAGQNIFFSIAELRLRITQMITANDKDSTSKKLLGGGYDALFGRSIGNLGEQASFRKVITMLSGIIFHEVYGQPCPRYVPGTNGTISGFARKRLATLEGGQGIHKLAADSITFAGAISDILTLMDGYGDNAPPTTDGKATAAYLKAHLQEVTARLTSIQKGCASDAKLCDANANFFTKSGYANITGGLLKPAAGLFRTAEQECGKAISAAKSKIQNPSLKTSVGAKIQGSISAARTALQKISTLEASVTLPKKAIPAVLKQQILRPDVWFSAPPRCNVLFPDQYSSLSYTRQFMAEPTRLLLKTNDEFFGEDELFDHFYFAPKAKTLKAEKNTLQAILAGDMLSHELFTGILPVFEKMGEFNIFAARSGIVDGKEPKIGLAQRSTNFLYFKRRFASRQLSVSAKFNPYLACGFPGLVIDKYVDLETFKLHNDLLGQLPNPNGLPPPALMSLLGTHFLGNFTEVSHQVDQQQGSTQINCSYARQPEESSEFLGNVQEEITAVIKKQPGKVSTRQNTVASIFPPKVDSQGPDFGRITAVKDVTSSFPHVDFENGIRLPVFGGVRDKKTKQISTRAQVGFSARAKDYGPEVVALVGDPDLVVRFGAYEVTEEKTSEKVEKVDLPPEEYIRPGWYGDVWHPAKISEAYYDFFAIGSITEPQQIQNTDVDGSKGSFTSNDASTVLADAQASTNPLKFARDQLLTLTLTKDASIQQAVSYLVLTYSIIRQAGFDAEEFIKSYTWRPIATMLDMFGSSDLQLDVTGRDVVQGVEGFHSRAFGPYEDLFALVTSDIESVVGIKRGTPIAQRADTRKRKYMAVLAYTAQLRLSKAILG